MDFLLIVTVFIAIGAGAWHILELRATTAKLNRLNQLLEQEQKKCR
jgi:hypothetical protein